MAVDIRGFNRRPVVIQAPIIPDTPRYDEVSQIIPISALPAPIEEPIITNTRQPVISSTVFYRLKG